MRFEVKKCDNEYCVFDNDDDKNVVAVCDVERISQKTCELLNNLHEENTHLTTKCSQLEKENEQLKSEIIKVIDRKIKNNDSNPSKDCYYKVNRALKDVRESLRDVIGEFER